MYVGGLEWDSTGACWSIALGGNPIALPQAKFAGLPIELPCTHECRVITSAEMI